MPGDATRPILDRIKENVFNLVGTARIRGRWWLDLFAGTGGVGIEALSRGADFCVFIENNREAIRTIHENLAITRLADRADVRRDDAFAYLNRRASDDEPFDVIYVAPPQYQELWQKTLGAIDRQPEWLFPNGIVIVQIDPREYGEATLDHLELYDQRRYGNTMLCFYERRQTSGPEE